MLRSFLTPLALGPFLFACGEPPVAPVAATTEATPPRAAAAPASSPEPAPGPPALQRDPYESYLGLGDLDDDGDRTRSKLETIPLDRLRLVGVVQQTAPVALLEDDAGEGHMVRVGTRVGTDGGLVTAIYRTGLVVEERFRDPLMRTIKVEKRLPLAPARG